MTFVTLIVEGAPTIDPAIYEAGIPLLGICYGAQLVAQQLGGHVTRSGVGEYGRTTLDVTGLGGVLAQARAHTPYGSLPVTEALAGRLLTLPPLTKVPERFVRECARALRKVADAAARAPARAPALAA